MSKKIKFGICAHYPNIHDIVKIGVLTEKYGLDSFWIPDHLTDLLPEGDKVDIWTTFATIGAQTNKIMFSPSVTDTQRIHPARTANIVATLDDLTNGRAALGIGAGEVMNTTPYGIEFGSVEERITKLEEAIKVIKLLWESTRDNRVNFSGKYFNLNNAVLDQKSIQKPAPPIYVGVMGTSRTLKIVGELGDGWIPWTNSVESYDKRAKIIEESAKKVNRNMDSIDMANMIHIAITDDEKFQREITNMMKTEILITNHPNVLRKMGFDPKPPEGFDYTYQRVLGNMDIVTKAVEVAKDMPDEIVEKYTIIGNVDKVIERIEDFIKVGANHIIIRDIIGQNINASVKSAEDTLQILNKHVIPHFK